MPSRSQVFGAVLAAALGASAGCSIESPSPGPTSKGGSSGGGAPSGGADDGGSTGSAGKPSGHSGSGGKTGSGGTAGTGGRAGAGGGELAGAAGAGGEPSEPCPGCESGFCLGDGTCVDCLPENDHCPDGQYCTDANVCAPGCKNASSCASGTCGADHSCERCISDEECAGDDLCNSGTCGPACSEADEGQQASCQAGLLCCSQHCKDVSVASDHCGACGAACQSGQFCGLSNCADPGSAGATGLEPSACVACHDVALANLCAIGKAIVILDTTKNPDDGNRAPGRAVGAALEQRCQPTPVVTEEEQDSVSALNFTTGRPVSGGGELLLVAGGFYYQNLEGYVEQQGISPLYVKVEDGKQQFMRRSDDSVVARDTNVTDTDPHDFFAVQFMRDPASGSLVLNFQGFWLNGTEAGAFFIMNGVLADLPAFDQAWYVYEWTDANGDQQPDLPEIVQHASGR